MDNTLGLDVAIAVVLDADGVEHKLLIPVIIHQDGGIVWEGLVYPLGPYGLRTALSDLEEITKTMEEFWPYTADRLVWLGDRK